MTASVLTLQEYRAEAARRFGPDILDIAHVCPRCGDVATLREFRDLGSHAHGMDCIGRLLGALEGSRRHDRKGQVHGNAPRGCDWTAYGLFPGAWTVIDGDRIIRCFALAPAREAIPA